jgi:hypothetical protein
MFRGVPRPTGGEISSGIDNKRPISEKELPGISSGFPIRLDFLKFHIGLSILYSIRLCPILAKGGLVRLTTRTLSNSPLEHPHYPTHLLPTLGDQCISMDRNVATPMSDISAEPSTSSLEGMSDARPQASRFP